MYCGIDPVWVVQIWIHLSQQSEHVEKIGFLRLLKEERVKVNQNGQNDDVNRIVQKLSELGEGLKLINTDLR